MNNTVYIAYNFTVTPVQPGSDILIAELGAIGFESFVEEETGILAYIQQTDWYEAILEDIQILTHPNFQITFTKEEIAQENWNATWEENFNPIQIRDLCVVRAPFHEPPKVVYDIVIAPKMSFGTGHHETTYMMLGHILEHDFKNKKVLDMGSGTGVLGILAAMRGAFSVDAIDVDNWCYLNALENVERNACPQVKVYEGDVNLLNCLLYTSPSPRDKRQSRMPSSA